jgi:chloramphenicol O-acetyltransferase type B
MSSPGEILKPWVRFVGNRLRFPRAQIGESSYISAGCQLAPNVIVGSGCHVFAACLGEDTHIGDNVMIGRGARTMRSTLGSGCVVEQAAELYSCALADFVSVQTKNVLTQVKIGRYSYVAREAYLNDVTIGSFGSIGPRALLGCGEHPVELGSTSPVFYSTRRQCGRSFASQDHVIERKPIAIGHDVWLGAQVFVRDGVTINDGAIIAAGAVVVGDVPAYAIMGGVPAKLIRYRFPADVIGRLCELRWWDWEESRLRAAQPWLAQSDINPFLRWAGS